MTEGSSTSVLPLAEFITYNTRLQASALNATRRAAGLPSDVAFHRSIDQEFAEGLDNFSERILTLTNKLLNFVSTVDPTDTKAGKGKKNLKLENQDDVVDNFHALVVDPMDQLLENTDMCLDKFLGRNKAPAIAINLPVKPTTIKQTISKEANHLQPVIQHAAHIPKPQIMFSKKPDNSDTPWHPTLSHKYNAKVPLGHIYSDARPEDTNVLVSNHPYQYEITHLNYSPKMFIPCSPMQPALLENSEAIWVSTPDEFQTMLAKLRYATEIAVDLEHHSYRSYSGFLCLMQISDRENDWVVDLLSIRDEVEALNEIFTDPAVVKVFHGAESDIVWLQQDLNIYVVNLFDTFHASKLLEFPRHGLANLLEMYCDFVPDKRYQLADWRIRPLPEEMLKYARSDTHFLLYIYDNLRNALLDRSLSQSQSQFRSRSPSSSSSSPPPNPVQNFLKETLSRSAETSLRVYLKEPYDATDGSGSGGWDTLARKWNKVALTSGGPGVGIGALQREVYRSVHGWRERTAREEDESTRYVLQNHTLFVIAEQPPADIAGLLALFKSSVPPVVKRRAKELLTVIKEAVNRGMALSRIGGQAPAEKTTLPVASVVQSEDVVMLETEIKKLDEKAGAKEEVSIWGQGVNQTLSTSHSSLFGSSQVITTSCPVKFAASVSMLLRNNLGSKTSGALTPERSLSLARLRSNEQVAKINRSFATALAVPTIASESAQPIEPIDQQEADGATGMQIEIPYVPASQRSSKKIEEETDTIVVVGQARQKRKRKVDEAKDAIGKSKEKTESLSSSQEPFDFSTAPNILDDNPDIEDRKKKRSKKQKQNKGGAFYGDFPAPPKAHSELKSGNQSYSFK